jgi:arylsulfate sulfotransferase
MLTGCTQNCHELNMEFNARRHRDRYDVGQNQIFHSFTIQFFMLRSARTFILEVMLLAACVAPCRAAMSVTLSPSPASPAPVGTVITWTPNVFYSQSSNLWLRFRVKAPNGDFQMLRDYGPAATIYWAASEYEGTYQIEVSVRDLSTGETASTTASYEATSLVGNNTPVISATLNPMVLQYSAPPCPVGRSMRVQFNPASNPAKVMRTHYKPCQSGLSMNFYLAGMPANVAYQIRHEIKTGFSSEYGPVLTRTIPAVSLPVPTYKVLQASSSPSPDGVILHCPLSQHAVATDLSGTPIWYYPGALSYLTRPEPGGFFFGLNENSKVDSSQQTIQEFDLVGVIIRETNAARVSEQLAALGKRSITSFHHEVQGMPDGNILVLAGTEQIMTNVQGTGAVDILGDMIVVLDPNLQVLWAWDAFDHLDPRRSATLGETCANGAGCHPYYLAKNANDWLHGNSLQLTPDGNILYSSRHQDWLIKINYSNGRGNGDIIWRLGQGGDFAINSSDPSPWFSHQHDGRFELEDNSILTVFDNGNIRAKSNASTHSRGQAYRLDEENRIAELLLNGDPGTYSNALGSAQKLHNRNYHFNNGALLKGGQSIEMDFSGAIVYSLQSSVQEYRSFRMTDLYSPYESNAQPPWRSTPARLRARMEPPSTTQGN